MFSIFLPLSLPPPPSIAAAARRRMQVKALSFLQLRRLDKVANFFSPPPLLLAKKEGQCTHAIEDLMRLRRGRGTEKKEGVFPSALGHPVRGREGLKQQKYS